MGGTAAEAQQFNPPQAVHSQHLFVPHSTGLAVFFFWHRINEVPGLGTGFQNRSFSLKDWGNEGLLWCTPPPPLYKLHPSPKLIRSLRLL